LIVVSSAQAHGQQTYSSNCGSLDNAYGPFDYTNAADRRDHLEVVEQYHFNRDVYELRRGMSGEFPLGDIEYTLRAFPNHHLALETIARLHRQANTDRFPAGTYSLTCWFERAARFKPTDGMVQMIHGTHLFALEQYEKAKQPLLKAAELMPQSPEAQYNLGLLFVKLRDYPAAREHARNAYALGFRLPGLREQLRRLGQWTAE
jgi:Flp pilus assembly protein TadD